MKPRPRQIDQNKAFTCVDSIEKFQQEEGLEQDMAGTSVIPTPDMILPNNPQKLVPAVAVQEVQGKKAYLSSIQFKNIEYNRYLLDPQPNGHKYELNELDYQFLLDFNSKIKSKYNYDPVKEEDLEKLFEDLDKKSPKEFQIEINDFKRDSREPFPPSIQRLDSNLQIELYNHWKKCREDYKRPLLRALMHPDLEDQNPHLAFRCRVAPCERIRILRRGNQQQQRGLQDLDILSLRVCSLKEEMNHTEALLQMIVVRDQGVELQRRLQYAQWLRLYKKELQEQPNHPIELDQQSSKYLIDDTHDHLEKSTSMWRKQYDSTLMEQEQTEEQYRKLEQNFKSISDQHHMNISKHTVHETEPFYPPIVPLPRPTPRQIRDPITKNPGNKEYVEERRESVARFLCTFYLEARKLHLSFDKVINNTMSLLSFTPPQQQKIVTNPTPIFLPNEPAPVITRDPIIPPVRKNALIGFLPMKRIRGNLILKVPLHNEWIPLDPIFKNPIITGTLNQEFFRKRKERIMQLAFIDGYANEALEDEIHDEELLKNVRKRVKGNLSKIQSQQQQSSSQIIVK